MRVYSQFLFILVILSFLTASGCVSGTDKISPPGETGPREIEEIQLIELNSIGLEGVELQLPGDWSFSAPRGEGTEKDLFHFHNADGTLQGVLRVEQAGLTFNREHYTLYGQNEEPRGITLIQTASEPWGNFSRDLSVLQIDGTENHIYQTVFTYKTARANKLYFTLRIRESAGETLDELTFREIYSSFNLSEPSFEKRIRKDSFMFRNFQDPGWKWIDDFRDGFILRHIEEEGAMILASVWTRDPEESAPQTPEGAVLRSFTYDTFIENQPVKLRGSFWEDEKGQVHAYVPVSSRGREYQIYLGTPDGQEAFRMFLKGDSLKRLLGNHLLFPR